MQNEEDNSITSTQLFINKDEENAKKFRKNGLLLSPESILFLDTFPGEEYKSKIMLQNISTNKLIVRITKPYSLNFQVNDDGSPVFLSPGLSMIRVVSFKCTHEKVKDTNLPIWINHSCYEVPIRVKHGEACLSVTPTRLNFGTIDLGARCVSRYLFLTNTGAGSSKFSIDLGHNPLDIVAVPKKGTMMPYSSIKVKLDLAAFVTGEHSTEFWVKGSPPTMIYVEVNVLMPFLQAVHPNTTARFTLIDFQPTYFGTVRYETLIVRNMSSMSSSFVVLAEINNELMTVDDLQVKYHEEAINYNCFSVEPLEGVLGPFEARIFTVWFHPVAEEPDKGWAHEQLIEREYLCFLRVFKVSVTDWKDTKESKLRAAFDANLEDGDSLNLRLCLHGSGQKPRIGVLTSSFSFKPVKNGDKLVRVIHLNNIQDITIFCKFVKSPGFQVSPTKIKMSGNQSVELTLFFRVIALDMSSKLIFDIYSYKNLTNRRGRVQIGQLKIPVEIGVTTSTQKPKPKFVTGITPAVAHEVGIHTDSIRFSDDIEKPKGMSFPKPKKSRPWLGSGNYIAFPNDLTKSFRVKETDKNKRSIFTGKTRYIPPIDKNNAFSEVEIKSIVDNKKVYSQFLRKVSKAKLNSILRKDDKDYCWRMSPSEVRLYKHMGMESLLEKTKDFQKKAFNFKFQDTFYPLTPKHLYNVRIMPKNLDFGQIPPHVNCTRTVAVENMNDFPVSIFLHVQKDPTNINDDHFVVGPKQRIEKNITLNLNSFGKYYSNVSFVVNSNDCFDMTLIADVVRRALAIVPNEIILNTKYSSDDIFQVNWVPVRLVNKLYVPTSFEWRTPLDSRFNIVPSQGVVPGQRAICCSIHFDTAFESYSTYSLNLIVLGGELAQLKITRIQDTSHNVNVLLQKKIFPPLSVNLKFVDAALLFNHGFRDAVFNVLNPNPLDGINIWPVIGKIPGKSCISISIDIQVNSVMAFDFNLQIKIQFKNNVDVKYVGFVFFPKVKFSPKQIELQNIPCYSLTSYPLKVENYGHSAALVNFLLEGFPQIKLSDFKKPSLPGYEENEGFTLQPGNSKDFYLHFMPCDFATYELLLPALLNQSIGPPKIHDDDSQLPMTYIKPAGRVNRILKNIDLSLPPKITSMRIDCSIGRGFISFSTFKLNFLVPARFCSQRKKLKLKNLRDEVCHVLVDTKILFSTYFYFLNLPKDGWLELAPREEIILQAVFSPSYPDKWEVEVPIIIREYNATNPYNYLNLTGLLHKSTLTCEQPFVQFLPVPVGISAERCIEIEAAYQFKETKLSHHFKKILGEQEDLSVEVLYPKGNKVPIFQLKQSHSTVIQVLLKFKSKKVVSQRGTLIFTDDCDGSCEILFTACADNSLMSCYKYLSICRHVNSKQGKVKGRKLYKTIEEQGESYIFKLGDIVESVVDPDICQEVLNFPMFPNTESDTSFAESMRSVVRTMENWLYEQGFSGSFRIVIGEHIAFSKGFISAQNSRAKNPNQACIKSIIDLLFIFVGRDLFLEYQLPTTVPEDSTERIEYALGVYKQVLKFIKVQGGNVSHIFPVYLLPFDDYIEHLSDLKKKSTEQKRRALHYQDIFEEKFSKKKVLPQDQFERFNKQAWLDVFLQIHRVVVQAKIPFMNELQKCLYNKNIHSEFFNTEAQSDSESSVTVYRTVEKGDKILIDWINIVYIQVKMRNPELNLPSRIISDFGEDLEDAVVLCVVTIFYCPYLIDDFFSDFYFDPSDRNQAHHNATLLCIAWITIRLGLTVTPEDFFMNPVFMTMLVTHLYSVLQSYIPQRSIEFLACLTSSVTRKISLINPNEKPIGYSVKILGDHHNSFFIDKNRPMVTISPKSATPISITFSAKKLYPTKATLLMCGHCIPNGYVENIVLTLHGDPYNLVISRDYTVNTPVMKPTFIVANISSPYEVEAEYDLWYTEKEPKPGELFIRPWSDVKTAKLPRSLFLSCDRLIVPPSSATRPAPLSITAACFTRTVLQFWIVLRNDEVGDFIIRVILKPKLVTPSVILRVPLPTLVCSGYQGTALCSSRCPRLTSVHIPSRNTRLWTTVKTMLAMTLQPKELSFWEKHYETRIGLDLMKWLLGKDANSLAKEISFIFESKINYKVTSMSPLLHVQDTLHIQDIHSYGFSELMVHLCCWVQNEFCVDILMESESRQEVRLYRLKFYGEALLGKVIDNCKKSCRERKPSVEGSCEYSENLMNEPFRKNSASQKGKTRNSVHK